MLTLGQPQFVLIRESASYVGHAMIIYKINVTEGKLYVADPNYPNNRDFDGTISVRTISYSNEKFDPYPSFAKVGEAGVLFDQIAIFGKTANIEWSQITKRYHELKSGTIGNDRFLNYDLTVKTEDGPIPLADGMTLTEEPLEFSCRNTNIPESIPETDGLQDLYIFNTSGELIDQSFYKGIMKIKLSEGKNKLGIYVCGYKENISDNYYDFQWFTVTYEPEDSSDNPDNPNTCHGLPSVIYEGRTYNTVQIGDQCWLKENLNVGAMITTTPDQEKDQENNGIIEKYCYENDSTNCNNFGGLYQWDEAMQYKTSGGSQGICPDGWHIPTLLDYEKLKDTVNADGNSLKAIGEGYENGAGTDTTGFSALLAGSVASYDVFSYAGEYAFFLTSSELGSFDKVHSMYLNYYDSEISLVNNAKGHAFSVRCIKD